MKPTILLTLLRGVDRLAEGLLDWADVELVTLYDLTVPILKERGIECRRFYELLSEAQKSRAVEETEWRVKAIAAELYGPAMRSCWPEFDGVTWDALGGAVTHLLRHDFFHEVVLVDTLRRWASETDLRLVIVHQDLSRDMKTLVTAARRLGVPSLQVYHGFPSGSPNMHDEVFTDVVAVFSEYAKDLMVRIGIPEGRLVVTGNFEWDIFSRPFAPGYRKQACATLGLDPARPVIVYALTFIHRFSSTAIRHGQLLRQTTEAVMNAFASLQRRHRDWQFVLRPHPNDPNKPQYLTDLAAAVGLEGVRIDGKTSPVCSVAMADLLVCIQSNLGISAILAGKPVVNCVIDGFGAEFFNEGEGHLFKEDDAVVFARRVDDIEPAIESALLDPSTRGRLRQKRNDTCRRFNYLNDGKATDRVCNLALDIVSKSHLYVVPADRYPEYEDALSMILPENTRSVLVCGMAARYVADRIGFDHSHVQIVHGAELGQPEAGQHEVVVLSDPVDHAGDGDGLLLAARAALKDEGAILSVFLDGASAEAEDAMRARRWAPPRGGGDFAASVGQYCRRGVELALSRCGFELEAIVPIGVGGTLLQIEGEPEPGTVQAWVVRGRKGAAPRTSG